MCSVYLWDLDHGFAGVVLIKKAGDTEKIKGCWDSIHVVEVQVCPIGQSLPCSVSYRPIGQHLSIGQSLFCSVSYRTEFVL